MKHRQGFVNVSTDKESVRKNSISYGMNITIRDQRNNNTIKGKVVGMYHLLTSLYRIVLIPEWVQYPDGSKFLNPTGVIDIPSFTLLNIIKETV
jgi:hypothetical protein